MSFQMNLPPSQVTKIAKNEEVEEGVEGTSDDGPQRKKREDYKKLKELEEMRKAGTAPAMKDEEGKDINPHIPQYIMQAPWYYGVTQATLKHQRMQPDTIKDYSQMNEWYKKGVKEGTVATKFRKGACDNCGAMTHKKKDCLERPRKLTAKYSGSSFAPDEFIQPTLDFDFDGKRDRWNGYDLSDHKKVVEDHQKIEEAKKILKAQKLESDLTEDGLRENREEGNDTPGGDSDDGDDEDKYADDVDMPGQKFETKQRITVRNLRIREDTAKYLYNLDVNSAHYDPKTRSMRENPFESTGKSMSSIPYAGDNFVRYSGDAMGMAKQQIFSWEAYEKGSDVHLQADPTKLEILAQEFKKRKDNFKTQVKGKILEKYGGEEHLEAPPKQLLLAQTEDYVEYSRHGAIIKGAEKAQVKSRYEEDVYLSNHSSVWGSYWHEGQWGFKCCNSLIKESYCTGEAGKVASEPLALSEAAPSAVLAIESKKEAVAAASSEVDEDSDKEEEKKESPKKSSKKKKSKKKKRKKSKKKKRKKESSSSDSDSSDDSDEDEEKRERKIKKAMVKETERVAEVNRLLQLDERKRPYNSMFDVKTPSEVEVEAFRRKRLREEDPMAKFL